MMRKLANHTKSCQEMEVPVLPPFNIDASDASEMTWNCPD